VTERTRGLLNCDERKDAEKLLLRIVQKEVFDEEMKTLHSLKPFRDRDGIIRIKIRLAQGDLEEAFSCPIVLPANHPLVDLIIRDAHLEREHAGIQVLQCQLREKYWIVNSRRAIRRVVKACKKCARYQVKSYSEVEAPLPKDRVNMGVAFEVTGVDLAGLLYLRSGEKAWIVVFTCAVYRTVHLELVQSLSTEQFLESFRRFIGRRGRPSIVYSDNGTNFVGAANNLKKVDWNEVEKYSAVREIRWKFNPLAAAWWGGFWNVWFRW